MHPSADHSSAFPTRLLVAVSGGASVALGLMVVTGWLLHSVHLIQLQPKFAPMQFNTALCLILCGGALVLWVWGRGIRAIPVMGGLVAAISGLTLVEYLFHLKLGIDQLLIHSYITTETLFPGRMSLISSLCFLLSGIALLLHGLHGPLRAAPLAVGALSSIVLSISLVALLGYVLGLPGTNGWTQFTRIPVFSAAGLSLLSAGLFLIAWHAGLHPGESIPGWLPLPLALLVFTGSLVLYFALEGKQEQDIAQTVRADAEGTRTQIQVRMESRLHSIARMARDWELSGPPTQAVWEANAAVYVHDIPDVQALEWVDAGQHVRWIAPLAHNQGELNNSSLDPRRQAAMQQSALERQPVITRIVSLADGSRGFIIYAPIIVHGQPGGFVAGIFKAETCLQRYLPPPVARGEAIAISEDGMPFFKRDSGAPPVRGDRIVGQKIELHGATWVLRMWPGPALSARIDSPLPSVVLYAGAMGALLLGAVSFYAQRSTRQAAETARANTALRYALDKVKTLEGLLPICSYCKRVRDDNGYWSQIDTYLRKHIAASFSHSYCPECAVKFYEECGIDVPEKVKAELEAHNYE